MKFLFSITLIVSGILFSPFVGQSQTYVPEAYWSFDNPIGEAENHFPGGCSLKGTSGAFTPGNINYLIRSTGGIVGKYTENFASQQRVEENTCQPAGKLEFIFREDFTVSFWLRTGAGFYSANLFDCGNFRIGLRGNLIFVDVNQPNNQKVTAQFPLNGIGPLTPGYLYDADWHHFALSYTPSTGTMKLYIDGISPPNATENFGPQVLGLGKNQAVPFSGLSGGNQFLGAMDEVALFDEVLPPKMIYQHYLNGSAGQHYDTILNPSLALPPPPVTSTGNYDPFDFGPDYPDIPIDCNELITTYPTARYGEGPTPRLVPWRVANYTIRDPDYTGNLFSSLQLDAEIYGEIAKNYNYYLFLGDVQALTGSRYTGNGSSNERLDPAVSIFRNAYLVQKANDPNYEDIPRFMYNNWGAIRYGTRDSVWGGRLANINLNTYPSDHYITDSNGKVLELRKLAPDIANDPGKMDSLTQDASAAYAAFEYMFEILNEDRVDCIGENGEIWAGAWTVANLQQDTSIVNDRNALGLGWEPYRASRVQSLRSQFLRSLTDSILQSPDQDSLYSFWYNVNGDPGVAKFDYDSTQAINGLHFNLRRATPYLYPSRPFRWYTGDIVNAGLNFTAKGLPEQFAQGDSLLNPGVSPGYQTPGFFSTDRENIRPGQFLGMLKTMGMYGADMYSFFDANEAQPYQPRHRMWQWTTPAYAQATILRAREHLYKGYPLEGDSLFAGPFRFSTGNNQEIVSVRKQYGETSWLISGAVQRLSNNNIAYAKSKDVSIGFDAGNRLGSDSLIMNIRPQGSTYVLEVNPNDTVFYQLDGWHEWKYPYWWCHDFVLEGELFDNEPASAKISTEFPYRDVYRGDLRDATSYVHWDGTPGASESLNYRFFPRNPDQDSLHFWIRYRTRSTPGQVELSLDSTSTVVLPVLSDTNWVWENLDSLGNAVLFTNLGTEEHLLSMIPSNSDIEIDKVFLIRSGASFDTVSNTVAGAADTVCLGEQTQFTNLSSLAPLCVDYTWDLGDGYISHESDPGYTYSYPGTYEVVLTGEIPSTGFSASDTFEVMVIGAIVDAGPDTMICPGDTLQMTGMANYFFQWTPDPTLDSSLVLDPKVVPTQSQNYYLTATDLQTGCSTTDSIYVTLSELNVSGQTYVKCESNTNPVEITPNGGYHVNWLFNSTLSSLTIPNPQANPTDSTVYFAVVSDYLMCATDTVVISFDVIPDSTPIQAFVSQDTICEGDTVQFGASGTTTFNWFIVTAGGNRRTWISDANAPYPLMYPLVGSGLGFDSVRTWPFFVEGTVCGQAGFVRDTAYVTVIEAPRPNGFPPEDTLYQCNGDDIEIKLFPWTRFDPIDSLTKNVYPVPGQYLWNPSANVTPFNDDTVAIDVSVSTLIGVDYGSHLGCPGSDSVWVIRSGIPYDSIYQCQSDSVQLDLVGATAVTWSPGNYFSDATSFVPNVSVPSSQWVYASVTGENGTCTDLDSVWIEVKTRASITTTDTVTCLGAQVQLQATGATNFSWWPTTHLSNPYIANPVLTTNLQDSIYLVTSVDSAGCYGVDSVVIGHLCCQANINTTFSNDQISNYTGATVLQKFMVEDTLFMDINKTFQNCEFYFDSMATVIVEAGVTIDFIDCGFFAVCGQEMWEGMVLVDSTSKIVINGSYIQDAVVGVSVRDNGMIEITNSEFRNNHQGIFLDGKSNTSGGFVTGTRFSTSPGQMLWPHQGELGAVGVHIINSDDWIIGSANDTLSNLYDSLNSGIVGELSNLVIQNNDFLNIRMDNQATGVFADASGHGIYLAGNAGTSTSVKYRTVIGGSNSLDNGFEECDNGILLDQGYAGSISHNDFNRVDRHSIRFVQCGFDSISVSDNYFRNCTRSIRGSMNPEAVIAIERNTVQNSADYPGISIWMDDMFSSGTDTLDGSALIKGNDIETFGTGILANVVGNASIVQNSVTIRGANPSNGFGIGINLGYSDFAEVKDNNLFCALQNDTSINMVGIWLYISDSTHILCNETDNFYEHIRINGPTERQQILKNEFRDGYFGSVQDLTQFGIHLVNNAEIGFQGGIPSLGADPIAAGNLWYRFDGLGYAGDWECGGVERGMVRVSGTNLNPVTDISFVIDNTFENPDHISSPQCTKGLLFPIDENVQNTLSNCATFDYGDSPMYTSMERIASHYLDTEVQKETFDFVQQQQIFSRFLVNSSSQTASEILSAAFESLNGGSQGLIHKRDLQLQKGWTLSESVEANLSVEETHFEIQEHWSSYLAEKSLSGSDSTDVARIANLCPSVYGRGVFQARTLLGILNPDWEYSMVGCEEDLFPKTDFRETEIGHRAHKFEITLFPNPVSSSFTVKSTHTIKEVQIWDLTGKKMMEQELDVPEFETQISVESLPVGYYLCKVGALNGEEVVKKLIVQ